MNARGVHWLAQIFCWSGVIEHRSSIQLKNSAVWTDTEHLPLLCSPAQTPSSCIAGLINSNIAHTTSCLE